MRATSARLVALLAVGACHSAAPATKAATNPPASPATDTCAATTGELPRSATSARLGGEYRVRLVANTGPRSGEAVDAHLRLAPLADSLQVSAPMLGVTDTTTRYPLAGSTDLDPALVGGVSTGDNASTDPTAPGVLVIERRPSAADAPGECHAPARCAGEPPRRRTLRWRLLRAHRSAHRRRWFCGYLVERNGPPSCLRLLLRRTHRPLTRPRRRPCRMRERDPRRLPRVPFKCSGGAGNRTLVRVSVQNRVYVRRLVFLPSPRVGAEPTSPRPSS